MGVANVIPGVSGGTIALILGIYQKFLHAISHFFKDLKNNVKFLLPVVLGMGIAIITMSNVISYSYEEFPVATTMFFMGLVLGGMPFLFKKVKRKKEAKQVSSYLLMFATFSLVIFMACSDLIFDTTGMVDLSNLSLFGYILLFLVGVIAAATMVVPGISGSLMLMLLGYYYPVLNIIKNLTKFNNILENLILAGTFGIGVLVGIVLISKLLEYLFQKYEIKTYCAVIGFIVASFFAIPISTFLELGTVTFEVLEVIVGFVVLGIGSLISYKLGEK